MGSWPDATPFELAEGVASPVVDEIVQGPAAALTAVALVAGERARASGWAARAAVAIARRWQGPRRVVLLDLDFERPALHEAAGLANEEGAADLITFGLSLNAVTQRAAAGFALVPAGLYAPEPGALLRHDGWTRVLLEAAAGRETLLAWLPVAADGMSEFVQRTGAVIVLADGDEADAVVRRLPRAYGVLAVLTSATTASPDRASGRAVPPAAGTRRLGDEEFEQIRLPTDRESRDALIAELRDRQRAARLAPPAELPGRIATPTADSGSGPADAAAAVPLPSSGSEHAREMRLEGAADDVDLEAIEPGRPTPQRSRYRRPLAWTVMLVLMLSVLAGAWRFLAGRIGWGVAADGEPASPAVQPEPLPVQAVQAVQEVELPWAVAIEAHTEVTRAANRVNALAGSAADMTFHVVPLERENTLYYHVMAGPVQDSARAVALRDTLLSRRLKTAATPTDVRYAPYAFLIGDYGTRAVAELQIEELQRLDIPSYLLLADAADGYPLYRVYVGGYAAAGEAEVSRQLLRAVGVRDSLVTRTGSVVP